MADLISRAAILEDLSYCAPELWQDEEYIKAKIMKQPAVDAIPVEWLNERHRKCCEEGDTDLLDAITVLCNEYHVWQKEQGARKWRSFRK